MKRRVLIVWTLTKVSVAVLFLGWCALYLRRWDSLFAFRLPVWGRASGLAFMMVGGLLVLACGGILATRGILTPGDRLFPKEFVASGPFRYLRNPMSLGVVTVMLGLGLYERSIAIMLFACALFLFLHLVVVYVEEPGLEKRFGDSYREYKRKVRRWRPGFGGRG
jgi:protein-S-isoprenylcysteine O-methyltransferase Ste14